jgi:hypothetical protein
MIVVAALLKMWIAGRDALQVLKLREDARKNDVLLRMWWTRYMLVPTSCALATALMTAIPLQCDSAGIASCMVVNASDALMVFSVFEFAQAAAFFFTFAIDLIAAGQTAFADRAYFVYLACTFSVPVLMGGTFARFAVFDGVDSYGALLFASAACLWLALFVAQHRHYSLENHLAVGDDKASMQAEHKLEKTSDKPYSCDACGKAFALPSEPTCDNP